jgi:hypothetical protein
VLTSSNKGQALRKYDLLHMIGGCCRGTDLVTDAGRFCAVGCFPPSVHLGLEQSRIKNSRALLLLGKLMYFHTGGTATALSYLSTSTPRSSTKTEVRKKTRRFRIFVLVVQSLFLQVVDSHLPADEANEGPM